MWVSEKMMFGEEVSTLVVARRELPEVTRSSPHKSICREARATEKKWCDVTFPKPLSHVFRRLTTLLLLRRQTNSSPIIKGLCTFQNIRSSDNKRFNRKDDGVYDNYFSIRNLPVVGFSPGSRWILFVFCTTALGMVSAATATAAAAAEASSS